MSRERYRAGRWFMAAMLSALLHGLLVLGVLIGWSILWSTGNHSETSTGYSASPRIFWESDKASHITREKPTIFPELVPFTAQLIPVSMVNQESKFERPARSIHKKLKETSLTGNSGIDLSKKNKSNYLLTSLRMESKHEQLGILIDRSLSMGLGGKWNQLVSEFDELPAYLSFDNRIRVWLFDKDCEEIAPSDGWGPWDEARWAQATRRIHETRPGGLTNLAHAIRYAALRGSTRIVVLSDDAGLAMNDWISVSTTLRRLGRPVPKLCAMMLGEHAKHHDVLATICHQTGGWCRYPNQ